MNFFITGTDTGVGKTFVSNLMVRASRRAGLDTVAMKPLCCGDRTDAELLWEAGGGELGINEVNPVWLRTPAAPYAAAALIEERTIDLDLIRETFTRVRKKHLSLIVEGVGGWMVPIQRDYFVADLAVEFGLPVVVVILNKLGAINHTLLTVRDIQSRGLKCAGLIFNNKVETDEIATATNRAVIEDLTEVPVLFEIQPDQRQLDLGVG